MDTKIGFVGLGQMGKWMALNVLKQGFDLTVFDLDQQAVKPVAYSRMHGRFGFPPYCEFATDRSVSAGC